MRTCSKQSPVALLVGLSAVIMIGACSSDTPTGTNPAQESSSQFADSRVSVCHRTGQVGVISEISASELAGRKAHGDYITHLVVTPGTGGPDDGIHFHRISDALAAVREGRLDRGEMRSGCVPDHH